MTSRERLLVALDRGRPDRLPVTTHHLMPWFLDTYLDGMSEERFFQRFGLDPVRWAYDLKPDEGRGEYWSPNLGAAGAAPPGPDPGDPGSSQSHRFIVSDDWRVESTLLSRDTTRYHIHTPGGSLSMVLRRGPQTDWVLERPLKEKGHLELFRRYAPLGICDLEAVRGKAASMEDGILRGAVPGFEIYGQPGCWQDAVELFGIQELIMETMDDPFWVRELLTVLRDRKAAQVASMEDAPFDLVELGGGSASSTVISPRIFQEFVAPYDEALIQEAHRVGLRVVYHTCGGMMPLLEMIADMGPHAMETFTPPALGGDTRLAEAKERIGSRVCMIGGFDQHTYFRGCSPEQTREAVRRCFREAGDGGGYILAPSDHFFDADLPLLEAFGEEARCCVYAPR
jgi:uroporphyrinogen decarboxylase